MTKPHPALNPRTSCCAISIRPASAPPTTSTSARPRSGSGRLRATARLGALGGRSCTTLSDRSMTASSIIAGSYLGRVVIARHAPAHIFDCLYDEDDSGVLALAACRCAVVGRFAHEAENRPPIAKRGSSLLRFAEHASNATSSQGERTLLRGTVWAILLSRRAKPVHNPVLYSAQQFVGGLLFDTAQRPREIEIGTAHEAKGQACRGFIRDRCHISHGVFPTKPAPQNAESIYRPYRIVNTAFDKSPWADFQPLCGPGFNIGQLSGGLAAKPMLGAGSKWRAPANGEGAAA
ncbi:hypothetical protein ABID82_000540 [Methylobacterium sp. PvP062]